MTTRAVALISLLLAAACGSDVKLNGADGDGDVIIRAHLAPDESCALDTSSRILSRGTFDIQFADPCRAGYDLNLLVENASSDDIVFDEAEITLKTAMDQTIVFASGDASIPNPFRSHLLAPIDAMASAVVTAQVIPPAYAQFLQDFVDGEILARVELHGQTDRGASVTSRTLTYPVDICEGCLTLCLQRDVTDQNLTRKDAYGGECQDDAHADGRICIADDPYNPPCR